MFDYAQTTALVTGASSGLGASFAEALAKRGANVVLVARSGAKLEALADRLQATHGVRTHVIVADLADPAAPRMIHAEAKAAGFRVNLLVNNAGFATAGSFVGNDLAREQEQIAVNVGALTALSHLFGTDMRGPNSGIINLASTAAFQPLPYSAVYGASKAFVLLFSEALGREMKPHGTHVLAVCPGPVRTAFWNKVGSKLSTKDMETPERTVEQALAAFEKRKAVLVPGPFRLRAQAFAPRLMPRSVTVGIAEGASRKIMMAGH
jgi:uncharacterized protein